MKKAFISSLVCCCLIALTNVAFAWPVMILSYNVTANTNCTAPCNGSINLTVTQGHPPFSYTWSTGATTEDIGNLCAGNYTVTVKDLDNVVKTLTIAITSSAPACNDNNPCTADGCVNNQCQYTPTNLNIGFTTTPNNVCQEQCTGVKLLEWDGNPCTVKNPFFTGFNPSYPNTGSCLTACGTNLYRTSGDNSCNTGRTGGDGSGFCSGGFGNAAWASNDPYAIRFDVSFGANDAGRLSALKFWELAKNPATFANGTTTNNNYPTKFGVRVLKNGTEIFLQNNISTKTAWTLETFDFSNNAAFQFSGATTFKFELLAYAPVGNGYSMKIWDLDDISVDGCCGASQTCNGSINLTVTGGTPPYTYSWSNNISTTTVVCQLITDNDDCEENQSTGSNNLHGSLCYLGYQNTSPKICGFRFANCQIPKNAVCTAAYIKYGSYANESNSCNVSFFGHKTDNSGAFTGSSYDLSGRTKTTSSVGWSGVPSFSENNRYCSPNLAPIVNEVCSRSGWSNGNSLCFLTTGSGQRSCKSREYSPSECTQFICTYTNQGPTQTGLCCGTYTVTVTDAAGCSQTKTITVDCITCDDNNSCTVDACANGQCTHTPVVCNDNNSCTTDLCVNGSCQYTPIVCNDNSFCTTEACVGGTCVYTPVVCNDNTACTSDVCNPASGCAYTPVVCNDNTVCTTDDCVPATGCKYTAISCNDNNACTTDACDAVTGCYYTPVNCDDGTVCTTDGCNQQTGCYHNPVDCADGNACTTDGCNVVTGCYYTPVNCDDYNACTSDGCSPTTGCYHTPVNCDDYNVCTTDGCNPTTGCYHTPVSCDDLNVCTTDGCNEVTGCYHNPVDCGDGNACTTDNCVPATGGCTHNYFSCNDNSICTTDNCNPATGCTYVPIYCADDLNACTLNGCDPYTGCTYLPVNCNDYSICTADGCYPPTGCYHNPTNCNDGNACTYDGCDAVTGCYHTPLSCDDGSACTTDGCNQQTGCYHNTINCDDGNTCTTDGCNPVTGCYHNATNCDDYTACTTDGCSPTTGCYHTPVNCDDGNTCTTDGCNPVTGCYHNAATNCDDNNVCTTDGCNPVTGCYHTPVNCDDYNACTTDGCNPITGCYHNDVTCNDNSACTTDRCNPASGCYYTPVSCDDYNVCSNDGCNPTTGCYHTPVTVNTNITKTDVSCNCQNNTNQLCRLNFAGLPHGTVLSEQYAAYGIHISAIANAPGKNKAILFNSSSVGTPDPDLQVNVGNLAVIGENDIDVDNNSLIDNPDDNVNGGKLIFNFDQDRSIISFVFVDADAPDGTPHADAYNAANVLIASVPIPILGDGSVQIVPMNVSGVRRLEIVYGNSGGTTDILFDCTSCCDGTAGVAPSGGTAPYTYAWSTGESAASIANLCPGEYCVTVSDKNGCQKVDCITIGNQVCNPCANVNCDDANSCTTDACSNGVCSHTPVVCNDNNACTNDACVNGQQCVYTPIVGCGQCPNEVTSLTLVRPGTGGDVATLTNNYVINYETLCSGFNIRANACTNTVKSVRFVLNGNTFKIESSVPFALNGDNSGSYTAWTPTPGSYTLKVIPYTAANAGGTAGPAVTIMFTVVGGTSCNDQNACTTDACNTNTGNCTHAAIAGCGNDPCANVTCNDYNACTSDACSNGQCIYTPITCNDNNACTSDACSNGCVYTPITCNDNNACTSDACSGGCVYTPITCNDYDACTSDACSGGCVYTPITCNDNNACTSDACSNGCVYTPIQGCGGDPCAASYCDDGNSCTVDVGDGLGGCTHTPVNENPKYLRVTNTTTNSYNLKMLYGSTSAWVYKNVIAGGNTMMCITLRDVTASGTAFSKIYVKPKGSTGVRIGNYIPLGCAPKGWITVCIPLSDFTGSPAPDFTSLPYIEIPSNSSATAYTIEFLKIEFTGGATPFLWYGDAHTDNYYTGNNAALTYQRLGGGACSAAKLSEGDLKNSTVQSFTDEVSNLNVYPNPFEDMLYVDFESAGEGAADIRIMDMLGQIVKTDKVEFMEGENQKMLNLDNRLADGMYFLEFRMGEKVQYVKLYKSK